MTYFTKHTGHLTTFISVGLVFLYTLFHLLWVDNNGDGSGNN